MASSGARITGGIVQEEHNADLRGKLGLQAGAKMRRTDAQVRAVEKVLSLPIRSPVWPVEEPDRAGKRGAGSGGAAAGEPVRRDGAPLGRPAAGGVPGDLLRLSGAGARVG